MSGSLSGGAGPPLALTAVTGRPHLFHLFLLVAKSEIIPIVPPSRLRQRADFNLQIGAQNPLLLSFCN